MKIGIPEQQDHPLAPNRPLEPITWRQARAEPHGYYERKAYADGWNDAVKVATASAKVSLMSEGAVEERIKTLMGQFGMPDSATLYSIMKQLQNEIEQGAFVVFEGEEE